ncbi:MAG: PKD domain-containing protein, partial [Solirubrobacterales bacterium]
MALEITGGFLKVGATLEAPLGEEDLPSRPRFDATISPDGSIFAAKEDFFFPHLVFPVEDVPIIGDLDIGIDIIPTQDVTGQINPDTGAMDVSIRLKIKATTSGLADVGSNCTIGTDASPITLNMSTATGVDPSATPGLSLGGIPYNEEDGTARVADKTFSAPAHTGCTGLAAGQINGLLGLPSPSGSNSGEFSLQLTPAVVSPIIPRYTATPNESRVPFPVAFDASNTVSNIGPITAYKWDFDGDGTVDETNAGPTTTHVYDTAGVYQTKLTVVTDNGEITRSRATITAKSILVTFNAKPPVSSTDRNPHFEFVANEPGATFECRFDQGSNEGTFAPCTSPVDYTNLDDNDYSLQVRASVDGDTGLPTVVPFRVDQVAPVATVTGKPANRVGASVTSGNVAFEANELVTFECRYRTTTSPTGDSAPGFGPCTSPTAVTWDAVEGTNTFDIRPTDLAGNVGEVVTAAWEVDLTAPVTTISYSPPDPTNGTGGAFKEDCPGSFFECLFGLVGDEEQSTTGNTAQRFDFTADDPAATFTCQLNAGPETPCISGVQTGTGVSGANNSYSFNELLRRVGNPVQGTNTFRVWATDPTDNRAANPTVATFVYDTVSPVITAQTGPADFTRNTTNTVTFQANETVAKFECRFINNTGTGTSSFATGTGTPSGFVPCTPGQLSENIGWYTANGQTEGRKGVQVRATDAAGNFLNTNNNVLNNGGMTRYWTVDRTAPVATIAAGSQHQGSFTSATSASFNMSSTDTPLNFGVTANGITGQTPTYQCSLNNGAFQPCTSPHQVNSLNAGPQRMRIKAIDAANNASSIVERTWTVVNASNASVTITSKPSSLSGSRDATFQFNPDATAECRLDPTEAQSLANSGWAACATGKSYSGLVDGSHTFQVRADGASTPASYTWTVYANLPSATFSSQPGILRPDAIRYTGLDQESADIEFSSAANPNGATTFRCRYYIQGDAVPAFEACESPVNVEWDKQAEGQVRKFEVEPTSATGNTGTVLTASWTIVASRPSIALGNGTDTITACNTGANGGVGAVGCVATASSTQPGLSSNVAAPRFQAVSGSPVNGVIGYACQLNNGDVQNPCTNRTSSFPAGGKPLTVLVSSSARGNNDNFGTAPALNSENTMKIWAVDNGGNLSDSPATYTWT